MGSRVPHSVSCLWGTRGAAKEDMWDTGAGAFGGGDWGPVADIGGRIGDNVGERGATDIVAEGVLESSKDGGAVPLEYRRERGERPACHHSSRSGRHRARRGGNRMGGLLVSKGRDAARISVRGRDGYSPLGEVKVGLGTATRQLPIRRRKKRVGAVWMKGVTHRMAEELRWESGQVVGELDMVFRISTEEKWVSGEERVGEWKNARQRVEKGKERKQGRTRRGRTE